jgi:hypothetical protein
MAALTSNSAAAKSPSPARLRAQRANAQLSTGPRTREGRRRSSLNRLGFKASGWRAFGGFEFRGQRDFLRVWRDLLALFWFIKPEWWREQPKLEYSFRSAAWDWSRKLPLARSGSPCGSINESIQSSLSQFIFEFRLCNQKCHCWLGKEFGADGRTDIVKLREAIEARLPSFHEAEKIAKKALGSLVRSDPSLHLSPETRVMPLFTPPSPGIFQKRTQSRKQKPGKEIGPEWPRYRVRF